MSATSSPVVGRLHRLFHPLRCEVAPGFGRHTAWVRTLPQLFSSECGVVLRNARNEIRELEHAGDTLVVKSFAVPNIVNRLVYGILRPSKAQRSFDYARRLNRAGIGSPTPVAWLTERAGLLFARSYYVSLKSVCPYTFQHFLDGLVPYEESAVLEAVAYTTARMHQADMYHKDYSPANILLGQQDGGGILVELVDLNRMHLGPIGLERGCRNFDRLPATARMHRLMAAAYARTRGFDTDTCFRLMQAARTALAGHNDELA